MRYLFWVMLVSCLSTVGFVGQIPVVSVVSAQLSSEYAWKTAYVIDRGHILNATMKYKLTSGEFANNARDIHGNKLVEGGLAEISRCEGFCKVPTPVVNLWIDLVNVTSPGTLILKIPRVILDTKMSDNVTDAPFMIAYDYAGSLSQARQQNQSSPDYMTFQEINKTADTRTLVMNFIVEPPNRVRFVTGGITGAPEFGSLNYAVLSISLLSVILITTIKFRRFS